MLRLTRRSSFLLPMIGVLLSGCLDESIIRQPELVVNPGVPVAWTGSGPAAGIGTTPSERKSGTAAVYLSGAFQAGLIGLSSFTLTQTIRADDYRGKRVRLSAWVRPRNVSNAVTSGIWMRVDGPGVMLQFDNMSRRPVLGAGDWRQVSVVLDIPARAVGIAFGALFQANNTLLIDDMALAVVDSSVASTNTVIAPQALAGQDSAATMAAYERRPSSPTNLGFEGVPSFDASTAAWITGNGTALATTDPTASLDELEPLRAMVGTARVVGLGEATHGTKEFALLKHRLARFLITRMGFTTFAIEATSAEADDLNEYLRTGVGDPARLLSHLYFWTWNTREVADMIAWMRQWNSTASAEQQVQFRGIDILYPSASIDSVAAFIHRVTPSLDADIAAQYLCLRPYRNTGNANGRPASEYLALGGESKLLCNEAMTAALALVRSRPTNAVGYQRALHHARLVQQFEAYLASTNSVLANRVRDNAMAENVAWLREQLGSDAKIIVSAHNDHITRQSNAMGAGLQTRYAADYRALAFAFGAGSVNAVKQTDTTFSPVQSFPVQVIPPRSIEDAFASTTGPAILLDMRKTASVDPAARALQGPIAMRSIGCCFDPSKEGQYFGQPRLFPGDFDLLLYVRNGTASTLLPYLN